VRKKRAQKRTILPDPKFNDIQVARFINNVLRRGKKHIAQGIVYNAMARIEKQTSQNAIDIFRKAIENARPLLEVRARRVGGATYQVPTEVRPDRSEALAMRWLIGYAKERKDKSMALRLASELIAASNKEGASVKKREDVHKMAEANKAFAHFRW